MTRPNRTTRATALALMTCMCGFFPGNALAAASNWAQSEGGAIRLITTGAPDAAGKLRGALEVQLKRGWKTYWRDPGSSGVAPMLDLGGAGAVDMQYPAPEWHNDGQFDWAGYTSSVSFPVTLTLNSAGPIEATAFIGLCETICIPFQATLRLDPAIGADDIFDKQVTEAAVAALPNSSSTDFGISQLQVDGDHVTVKAAMPQANGASLFLAGERGYQFGKPILTVSEGSTIFRARIISRPATRPDGPGIAYTLTTAAGASVSGVLPYF